MWYGSINIDGVKVVSVMGENLTDVFAQTHHYLMMYSAEAQEAEKRVTFTIQKRKA